IACAASPIRTVFLPSFHAPDVVSNSGQKVIFRCFSSNIAYRFTIPENEAPGFLDRESVSAFLGGSAHLVCYPLSETGS
ncbi:hypothetical protein ACC761_40390, partial [Rhizobium ruizarguesonis]